MTAASSDDSAKIEVSAEGVAAHGGKPSGVAQSGEQPGNAEPGHGPAEYGKVAGSSPATGRTLSATTVNKLAVAIAVREAMRQHRRGKPISFQTSTRPPRPGARNLRESDYAE